MRELRAPGTVVALVVMAMVLVHGCKPSRPMVISGMAMGTRYHVKLADSGPPVDAIEREIDALLEEIEADASQWRKSSWISGFNAGDSLEPVPVPEHAWQMLLVAKQLHDASGGLLDVTVGPLVELWGFGHRPDQARQRVAPTDEEVARTLARCGFDKLVLDRRAQTVRRTVAGVQIDLSALAKGYAVDRIDEFLQDRGSGNHLIEFGGELLARGTRAGAAAEPSEGWRIRLPGHHGRARTAIDTAYATSGGSEQNRAIDDLIVTHLVDPRTGRPTADATGAVTVTADRCVIADAWATALSVATRAEARQLAQKAGIDLMDWRD